MLAEGAFLKLLSFRFLCHIKMKLAPVFTFANQESPYEGPEVGPVTRTA
jgi:hypothetical protein